MEDDISNIEDIRNTYWKWWMRDPIGFFSHVKPLREHLLLEIVQWSKEF